MYSQFHQYLLESIRQGFKSEIVLANEITDLLDQSKSNVYKKIKGDVPFSTEEVLKLSRHFGISLDHFAHKSQGNYEKISFDYSIPKSQPVNNPETFLEKLRRDLEYLVLMPQAKLVYATTGLPIFHSLECRNLLAFKLFVWCRINWQLPGMEDAIFDAEAFYDQWPTLEENREILIELYHKIHSKEFWPKSLLINEINQIQYYRDGSFFKDDAMPEVLKNELTIMLKSRSGMASSGYKKHNITKSNAAVTFDLFLNELAFTNNLILIYSNDHPVAAYATMDNPNFMRSVDPIFCNRMHEWVRQIEKCSFHTGNDHYHAKLFRNLLQQVNSI